MGPSGIVEALGVSAKRSPRLRDTGIAGDVGPGLLRQHQGLGRLDRRDLGGCAVGQPVQQVQDVGLGGHTGLPCHLHGNQHSLFIVLQHDRHEYELYLAVENIDHTRTKARSPRTNGICERFRKTLLDELYRVAFRKKVYRSIEELQADLDEWVRQYNKQRTHQGRWCFGKTPMQTFLDSKALAREKQNMKMAA